MESNDKEVAPIQLQNGHLFSKYIFIDILGRAFSRDKVEKLLKMLSKNTHVERIATPTRLQFSTKISKLKPSTRFHILFIA
ncbi:UNKNOWN [Stylonychia lemnae]|uniref:Uncharacterized protein n=1 Tax=Stylonychia lemnae TaxID=5949 RepID=A0A077ZRM1_STYLE|nr:UNKNOWN [Stylonychia lemnae]|eukprot:CDW72527.1 UNKNOWN [Stylonychia lemnae]